MALSGKYISIYEIIERVFIDVGYNDVPLHDAVVWAGRAMDRIGVIMAYERAPVTIIKVENNRGEFPCDMHKIIQMRDWPSLTPLVESRDNFAGRRAPSSDEEDRSKSTRFTIGVNTYVRDGDFFYPFFDEGEVELSYMRYPTDNMGFPLIPADTKYADAVAAYIQMKLDFRAWRKNEISGDIYMASKRDYAFKAGQAKSKALLYDTVDQMQAFVNQFRRLVPNINFHKSGFANSTVEERRRNNPTGIYRTGYLR